MTAAGLEDVNQPLLLAGRQANLLFQPQLLFHIPGQLIISSLWIAVVNLGSLFL